MTDKQVTSAAETTEAPVRKRNPRHYLNRADLLDEVIKSNELGYMSDTLAKMLMLLVDRISSKSKFSGYSFLDEMKGNALLTLVRVWTSFKPERSDNPFAYYTQVVENAFIQYLKYDKKQRNIRDAVLVDAGKNPSHAYAEAYQQNIQNELEAMLDETDETDEEASSDEDENIA